MSCLENFANQLQIFRNYFSKRIENHQKRSGGIPLVRKLCYAVGGVPYQMTTAAISISLQIFLLDVVQMKTLYVSMILFVSRAWDAVTDPVVGFLVSRSNWTPIGKLTPWLLISTPFCMLVYVLLWFVPSSSIPEAASVTWFLVVACLFETLMSCYNVPYVSLSMFLGGHQRDRDSATAYRMSVEMVAMLLASVIQGQVVSVYNAEKQDVCEKLDQIHPALESTFTPPNASLQETKKAFLTSALVMAGLFFFCSLVLFFGAMEQPALLPSTEESPPSYLRSIKILMCFIPYQRLILGFVFSVLAFQMSLGNFALFCSHAAGLGEHFQLLLLVLLVSASVAVPFWQIVLLRIGKKTTVFVGLSLLIPALIVVACVPNNLPVFMTMCVLMGVSVATLFLLPWSMLPDVVDDFAEKHSSFRDLEPLFFSGYAFCSKLAGGLSAGLSTMTLQVVGYKASACNHGDEVVTALVVIFSPVPVMLLLVAMLFFSTYPIDERRSLQPPSKESSSSPADTGDPTQELCHVASISHLNRETNASNLSDFSPNLHQRAENFLTCLSNGKRCKSHVEGKKQTPAPKKGEDDNKTDICRSKSYSFTSRSYEQSKITWV